MSSGQIVLNGELALSRRLMKAGFRYEALHRNDSADFLPRRHDANPMLLFWRELLFEEGVPFLKIELLRDNPIGVEDATTILQAVAPIDPLIRPLIRSHLERTTDPDKPRRPLRPLLARYRYALIRKRYRLKRENRRLAAAWNLIKLETLTLPLSVWRRVRILFGLRQGPR